MDYNSYSFSMPNNNGEKNIAFTVSAGDMSISFNGILDTDSTSLTYNEWVFIITDDNDSTFKRSFILHLNTIYFYLDSVVMLAITSSTELDNTNLSNITVNVLVPNV